MKKIHPRYHQVTIQSSAQSEHQIEIPRQGLKFPRDIVNKPVTSHSQNGQVAEWSGPATKPKILQNIKKHTRRYKVARSGERPLRTKVMKSAVSNDSYEHTRGT